ncbi:uncharacterized protein BKA55DRAFT_720620 [Fusarium redolens]|uniref:Uncharacterized protein n=1 Tax=Fusarium redolens TaxID=48865 RepID=A0A9P9FWV1_FUSRE|nr:uncharacterized protein BKA55DRAFT_720620 [Fusarium redolens]KAH7207774.1 hypothetical protein BKA55DRAFT_720620 [Fusarium redolens]
MHLLQSIYAAALLTAVSSAAPNPLGFDLGIPEQSPGTSQINDTLLGKRAPFKVAWGEQIQNGVEENKWVAWVEGDHACPGQAVFGNTAKSNICYQPFNLKGISVNFFGCSGNSNPTQIGFPYSPGGPVGGEKLSCGANGKSGKKINCSNQHDIKQHGYCQ